MHNEKRLFILWTAAFFVAAVSFSMIIQNRIIFVKLRLCKCKYYKCNI